MNTVTNQWHSFGENKGGTNSINCLMEILGMNFQTAVRALTGNYTGDVSHNVIHKAEKKKFTLPQHADNMRRVFAYLCQARKIRAKLVSRLAHDGLLYQDIHGNAVFIHRDERGDAVGAEIQGTCSEKRYKGVAKGTSDSVFSVKLGEPRKCYVFESAIDLLSFQQLTNPLKIHNSLLVSMAGLKFGSIKRIVDSGIPIYSCVDNDSAGKKFSSENDLTHCRRILEENNVKDFNELLRKFSDK